MLLTTLAFLLHCGRHRLVLRMARAYHLADVLAHRLPASPALEWHQARASLCCLRFLRLVFRLSRCRGSALVRTGPSELVVGERKSLNVLGGCLPFIWMCPGRSMHLQVHALLPRAESSKRPVPPGGKLEM